MLQSLRQGAYRIQTILGQGGFGITYLGTEAALDRPVAVKEHFPWGCQRGENDRVLPGAVEPELYQRSLDRFSREARLLAQFDHPGIVRVLTVFEENNTAYLVMEYVQGPTLAQILERDGPQPGSRVRLWAKQLGHALAAVHHKGLLHRDLKPDNLILTDQDRLVLVDFGAALHLHTQQQTAIVSHGYSPPEQYSQICQPGPAADLYSLGATLYHLLTGSPPPSSLERMNGAELPPLRPGGRALREAVERCLSMDRQARPTSAAHFLELLEAESSSEIAQKRRNWVAHRGWIRSLAFDPMGRFLASGSEDKTVGIWDPESGLEVARLDAHSGWVWQVGFNSQGSLLFTTSYDRELICWDSESWTPVRRTRCTDVPLSFALLETHDVILIGTLKQMIEVRSLPDLELLRTMTGPGPVEALQVTSGPLVVASTGEARLWVWDYATGNLLEGLKGHSGPIRCVHTLEDGRVTTGGSDRQIRIWEVERGESTLLGQHDGTVWALADTLYSASGDKTVKQWDVKTGKGVECHRHKGEVTALAYHPVHGLASAGQDLTINVKAT